VYFDGIMTSIKPMLGVCFPIAYDYNEFSEIIFRNFIGPNNGLFIPHDFLQATQKEAIATHTHSQYN
jgi:hypothetical protein